MLWIRTDHLQIQLCKCVLSNRTSRGVSQKLTFEGPPVPPPPIAVWRARKSSQHHKTFQINSSLTCQNAFPLPSTPARDYRDVLWNGLIVQGINDFYSSICGCALNCEFQIQTTQGPRPWAASAAEALCCFAHLKLADMFKLAAPLLNLRVIALREPSDSRPTCVRAMKFSLL